MNDIKTDLWTVRDVLAKAGDREGLAAIGRISEEIDRLSTPKEPHPDAGMALMPGESIDRTPKEPETP